MTKTTNYEISKKLAEIGFRTETEKCWAKIRHSVSSEFNLVNLDFQVPHHCDEWVLSYDLETLLDALPEKIKVGIDRTSQSKFYFDKISFGYAKEPKIEFQFYCRIQENESLADTAGRLIILLHENNLIKF
jgi:hypothetical protein